jgi:hypothetical protein
MTTPDAWDAVEPQRAGVPVLCLGAWEGPLDQLLDLARREKVDLARLSIAEMAEQFNRLCLAALAGQQVPLSRGADWLVMASWLALLRAQLFLPPEALPPDARAARPDRTADRERALEAVREITGPFCVDFDTEGGVAQSSHVGPMSCASISSVADLPHIFWNAMIERRPRDCLTFGGQAAAAKVGWVSFAGENLCPKAEPKVPL